MRDRKTVTASRPGQKMQSRTPVLASRAMLVSQFIRSQDVLRDCEVAAAFLLFPRMPKQDGDFAVIEIQPYPGILPRYMLRADAAPYLRETYGIRCVAQTLAKYACTGAGAAFRKAGKFPIYSRDDLDAWASSRLSEPMQSTSAVAVRTRRS
jgi:hypothetical protein